MPPRPPLKVATPPPHEEAVGRGQYRSHNADRSEFRLLNVLPRTILGFPSEGKAKSGRAARFAEQTSFAPNTETFSAVHTVLRGVSGAEPH